MSQYLQWLALTLLTGNPVLSAVVVLLAWWVLDRFTLQVLPNPARSLMRWLRIGKLRAAIEHNPHDRRARLELAQLYCKKGRYERAIEVVRPNVQAGDDDAETLFVMGQACLMAGHLEQGEVFLRHVDEVDPDFRVGEVSLVRGRAYLSAGEPKKAKEALERFVQSRRGTVEGRVLLARALERLGDDASAAMVKDEAWREYRAAPRFRRRQERFWAWRAKPSRPATYALVVVLVALLFARFAAPRLAEAAQGMNDPAAAYGYSDEGY